MSKKKTTELQFAPSTFGQKKRREPIKPERLEELRALHASMVEQDENGEPVYPSKTAFVVKANEEGYTTREIGELLGQKPAVIYSMIWRVTSGYKPKSKKTKSVAETQGLTAEDEQELEDLDDEELDELDEEDI